MLRPRRCVSTALAILVVMAVTASFCYASEAHKSRLSNGVTVITKPASWNRVVAIAVAVEAGSKYDPAKLAGLANLTSELLVEGTRDRDVAELAELADRHGIDIRTYATVDFAGFHIACIDENFDVALELAAEILSRPAFDETRLLRVQERILDRIDADNEDSSSRNYEQLYENLFGEHPYGRPVSGSVKTVERIDRERVEEFYSKHYLGESTVISIVGNFPEKEAIASLGRLLSTYPSGRATKPDLPDVRRGERLDLDELFMDVDQSRLSMGFLTPSAPDKDYAALRVLTAILGGSSGSRLNRALESDGAGLAINVDAFCFCAADVSAIVVTAATSDVDATLDAALSEVERLRTEPVSEEELVAARNRVSGSVVVRSQTNLTRALRLSLDYLATGRVDALDTYLEQVSRVSRGDILRVSREYLVDPAVAAVRPGRSVKSGERPATRGI